MGKSFGRHKLIKLSPNKTWEGFLGGFVLTQVFCIYWTRMMLESEDYKLYTCGTKSYSWALFENWDCEPDDSFVYRAYELPIEVFGIKTIEYMPAQIYTLWYSIFASWAAPFMGFLASAMKRAYGIKDFATTLPGHGGFTDRFDCVTLYVVFSGLMLGQVIYR